MENSVNYKFYHACFDDYVIGNNGGLTVKASAFEPHKLRAEDTDPGALWGKIVSAMREHKPDLTGVGNLYRDYVNNCTYVIFGNYYYEDMGVIVPCLPEPDYTKHN